MASRPNSANGRAPPPMFEPGQFPNPYAPATSGMVVPADPHPAGSMSLGHVPHDQSYAQPPYPSHQPHAHPYGDPNYAYNLQHHHPQPTPHSHAISSVQLAANRMLEPVELSAAPRSLSVDVAHPADREPVAMGWLTPPRDGVFQHPNAVLSVSTTDHFPPNGLPAATTVADSPQLSLSPTDVRPSVSPTVGAVAPAAPGKASASGAKPRRETSMAVIACRQCRARKIRCDSNRPVCNNCVRRNNECLYDAAPKRRGPDKVPGTRRRSTNKKRSTRGDAHSSEEANGGASPQSANANATEDEPPRKKRRSTSGGSEGQPALARQQTGRPRSATSSTSASGQSASSTRPLKATQRPQPPTIDTTFARATVNLRSASAGVHAGELRVSHPPRRTSHPFMHHAQQPSLDAETINIRKTSVAAQPLEFRLDPCDGQGHPVNAGKLWDAPVVSSHEPYGAPTSLNGEVFRYPLHAGYVSGTAWWDELLAEYSHTKSKDQAFRDIHSALSSLFNKTAYFLCFINVPLFLRTLSSPEGRQTLQPALVYAGLALTTLVQSSEVDLGNAGRNRALWLCDAAQQALDRSWVDRWVDLGLAQAALLLALFESASHSKFSTEREWNAIARFDQIVQTLQLTFVDNHHPDIYHVPPQQVPHIESFPLSAYQVLAAGPHSPNSATVYASTATHVHSGMGDPTFMYDVAVHPGFAGLPHVQTAAQSPLPISPQSAHFASSTPPQCDALPVQCSCTSPSSDTPANWTWSPPAWGPESTDEEIRYEERRRLVWTGLMVVANYAVQSVMLGGSERIAKLFLMDPCHYRILFPGEAYEVARAAQSPASPVDGARLPPRDSAWALFCRSLLLWNGCFLHIRAEALAREVGSYEEEERSDFVIEGWNEVQELERRLRLHVCNINTSVLYMAHEHLHHSRVLLTAAFRHYQGLAPRNELKPKLPSRQAEQWIAYSEQGAKRLKAASHRLGHPDGHLLTQNPWLVGWLANQLAICLCLFDKDRTVTNALELAKLFLSCVDVVNALWPSAAQRERCHDLRVRLDSACQSARIASPLPPDFSLPPALRSLARSAV